jgi:hypothetical protein
VLGWVGVGMAAAAAGVAGRWYFTRRDSLGRRRDFPLLTVVMLCGLAVATGTPTVLHTRLERRLSAVASALVGDEATVRCPRLGASFVDPTAELGFVRYLPDGPERVALVKWDQCRDLAAYLRSDKRAPSKAQVVAVHVLTHEAMHMAGELSESGGRVRGPGPRRRDRAAARRHARTGRSPRR